METEEKKEDMSKSRQIENTHYVFLVDVSASMKDRIKRAQSLISLFQAKPHTIYIFGDTFRKWDKPIKEIEDPCEGNEMVKCMDECADELMKFPENNVKLTMITSADYHGV